VKMRNTGVKEREDQEEGQRRDSLFMLYIYKNGERGGMSGSEDAVTRVWAKKWRRRLR
jgi:hypothetical protein